MKESRLFRMLYYILEKKKVTAKELAEEFEISIRTVYRDLDWISLSGIPIYTKRGKQGGIYIDEGFTLNESILSRNEKEEILTSLNALQNKELIRKLSATFNIKNKNWLDIDFSKWHQDKKYDDVFQHIKASILNKNIIEFNYFGSENKETHRRVKPIRILFKNQDWYVYAFCMLRNDFRFFKLKRITNLQIQSHFTDDFSDIHIPKEMPDYDMIHVKLKFDKAHAFRVYDELNHIIEKDDYLYVAIEMPNNYILYHYILSFGDGVEVLDPKEIRDNIKIILENALKKYI